MLRKLFHIRWYHSCSIHELITRTLHVPISWGQKKKEAFSKYKSRYCMDIFITSPEKRIPKKLPWCHKTSLSVCLYMRL